MTLTLTSNTHGCLYVLHTSFRTMYLRPFVLTTPPATRCCPRSTIRGLPQRHNQRVAPEAQDQRVAPEAQSEGCPRSTIRGMPQKHNQRVAPEAQDQRVAPEAQDQGCTVLLVLGVLQSNGMTRSVCAWWCISRWN